MAKNDPFWRKISKSQKCCKHRCDHRLSGNYRHKNHLTLFYAKINSLQKESDIRHFSWSKEINTAIFVWNFAKGLTRETKWKAQSAASTNTFIGIFFLRLHKPQQWNQLDNPRNLTFIHKFPNPNSKNIFDNFEVYPHIFEKEVTFRKFLVGGNALDRSHLRLVPTGLAPIPCTLCPVPYFSPVLPARTIHS